ncbi:beta-glucosidase BglX [Alteribacter aurantiacus]|uniref:beta-glucosidase BglX n=1 Tax=Alteribacter aurantiacus TaxID=254410 RepID=UPI00040ACBE3|nr:beta-glucosidase BglX [Alteribacter aurantiacus]
MNQTDVKQLLEQMTQDEKIAQLMQLAGFFYEGAAQRGEITGPMEDLGIEEETIINSGSVLGASGAGEVRSIQEAHLKKNRLGIPLLMMADIIHGYKTIFPVPLGISCSWNLDLAEKSAEAAAKEAAVSGVHVTFAPMTDLVRDPRWGRVMESTGEDPFLNSEFAKAFVRGFQGDNLKEDLHRVAACVKHFAAYGASEGGRDYNSVDMSERQLREMYLPAYKAALDEGCEMVMTAFNIVDGIPATGNKRLMRDILRDEWGFDGVMISDWGAVKELIPHGTASNEKEAGKLAIEAGVDIEMMTACYANNLKELMEEGQLEESLVDEAVLRILTLKDKLGLFEKPHRGADVKLEEELVFSKEHRQLSRDLAAKSCVLLKNEGVLPLGKEQKVLLVGPFASSGDVLGPWSWKGPRDEAVTMEEGMKRKIGANNVSVAAGCGIEEAVTEEQWKEIELAVKGADVIVAALGERSEMSGEGGSRADIMLPLAQVEFVRKLKRFNKPVAVVLFNGRPLDLHGVTDQADALLEAWYPGTEAGDAVADLLFGEVNPSGKLTMSFPYAVGQVPVYYNRFNTGRPQKAPHIRERYVSQYLDIPNEPLFPFGFGLSYTSFFYSNLSLSGNVVRSDESIRATVTVTNQGEYAGEETVQLYIKDEVGEVVRPLKELKGFKKVFLKSGESQEITFKINETMLRYTHSDLGYRSDAGSFTVFIGTDSENGKTAAFELELTK